MKKILIPILILAPFILMGCSTNLFTVHKSNIQQGNSLTNEDIEKVQIGVSQTQVKQLLGLPVLIPAFNANRWDYVYSLQTGGREVEKRGVSIYFNESKVSSIKKL